VTQPPEDRPPEELPPEQTPAAEPSQPAEAPDWWPPAPPPPPVPPQFQHWANHPPQQPNPAQWGQTPVPPRTTGASIAQGCFIAFAVTAGMFLVLFGLCLYSLRDYP